MVIWSRRLGLEKESSGLLQKCRLVRPSCGVMTKEDFCAKWGREGPVHVVFCGLSFETKGGACALASFERILKGSVAIHLTYVGDIPRQWQQKYKTALRRIDHYSRLARREVLSLLATAHILFHPAASESYGMVLVEAAASGMAIVAARRRRLALSREFLAPSGGPLLDENKVSTREEACWFGDSIIRLASDWNQCRRMAWRNWRKTTNGQFSKQYRDQVISKIVSRSVRQRSAPILSLAELSGRERVQIIQVSSKRLGEQRRRYREKVGLVDRSIVI